MSLSLIAVDLAPISVGRTVINGSQPLPTDSNAPPMLSPTFLQQLQPTHTLAETTSAPFDVIIVPGGLGTRQLDYTQPIVDWLGARAKDPALGYMMTVCTGASLLVRSGAMAGRNATTNKWEWDWVRGLEKKGPAGEKVNWIGKARWVVDGNLWSSSGVSAGVDMMLGWVEHMYGADEMIMVRNLLEWNMLGKDDDPYAELYGIE